MTKQGVLHLRSSKEEKSEGVTRAVGLTEWLGAAGWPVSQCLLSTTSQGALQAKAGLATSLQSR